jgi:hypothetical protein
VVGEGGEALVRQVRAVGDAEVAQLRAPLRQLHHALVLHRESRVFTQTE